MGELEYVINSMYTYTTMDNYNQEKANSIMFLQFFNVQMFIRFVILHPVSSLFPKVALSTGHIPVALL